MKPQDNIVWLASRLVESANAFIARSLKEEGFPDVSPSHGDILASLVMRDGKTVSELARATHRTKSTVSVMVDRLAANGYVEKRADAEDSRAVGVWLTEKGRGFEEPMRRISDAMNARLSEGFRAHETEALADFLARANENLSGEKDFVLK